MTKGEAIAFLEAADFEPGRDEVTDQRFATPSGAKPPAADAARRKRDGIEKACEALESANPEAYAERVAKGKAARATAEKTPKT